MSGADLSTFLLSAREMVTEASGLLTISAHVIRTAITTRYMADDTKQRLVHQDLARFFQQPDEHVSMHLPPRTHAFHSGWFTRTSPASSSRGITGATSGGSTRPPSS